MRDIEERIGIVPLDQLLQERGELVESSADLFARYGPYGTAEARLKTALAVAELQVRADFEGSKVTEKFVEARARTHPLYLAAVDATETGRAKWAVAQDRIQGCTDAINRGQVLARAYANEPRT